ncbi:ABC transporter permease [Stappia sp. ES.058]|uniref:ABC transporter permease n=1 Tax=Stappia sp. ES.058 TaxID=1881061 RepID=UPI00087C9700|nr:ABC transporter permease [Stappia sp. ES.058]SDU44687.1 NitT/TauT family transport system permease protein [Stappia sp. ES.058]
MTSAVQSAPAKSPVARILSTGALVLAVVAILLPVIDSESLSLHLIGTPSVAVAVGAALVLLVAYRFSGVGRVYACLGLGGVSYALAFALIGLVSRHAGDAGAGFWAYVVVAWAMAWLCVEEMAALEPRDPTIQRLVSLAIPLMFGIWLLLVWQLLVVGFGVPRVLLPPPSEVWLRLLASPEVLWKDFQQTFLKGVLIGYTIGCGSGFLVAILVDRVPFLRRGLLPIGNLVSALPIIGVAPIMVMWFGFDWPSKAAVVIIMTFFPMLVNTVTGLAAADRIQHDLMHTYAADYRQTLVKMRLPMAMPFIFNALKINSTLALIGAIVAEFFGTPTVGMGFRISTEVGRMNIDMVWASIAVAALAGSLFYGLVALVERVVTFWHPSVRG